MKLFTRTLEITLTVFLVLIAGFRYQLEKTDIQITTIVIISMAAAAWAVALLIKKDYTKTPDNNQVFVFYILTIVTSTVHAYYLPAAILELYLYFLAAFIFLGVYNLIINGYPLQRIENAALITGAVYIAIKIGQVFINSTNITNTCTRLVSLPNKTAAFTTLVLILAVAAAITRRRKSSILPWLLVTAAASVLLLTVSRAGLIAAVAGVTTLLVMFRHHGIIKIKIISLVGIISLMLIIGLAFIYVGRPVECVPLDGNGNIVINGAWNNSISTRKELYKYAITMLYKRPLLGYGPGNFQFVAGDQYDYKRFTIHAHNLYLNIAAERGLLGLLSFAALAVVIIKELARSKHYISLAALAALAAAGVHGLADVPTIEPFITRYLIIILAMGLSMARKVKDNERVILDSIESI